MDSARKTDAVFPTLRSRHVDMDISRVASPSPIELFPNLNPYLTHCMRFVVRTIYSIKEILRFIQ